MTIKKDSKGFKGSLQMQRLMLIEEAVYSGSTVMFFSISLDGRRRR